MSGDPVKTDQPAPDPPPENEPPNQGTATGTVRRLRIDPASAQLTPGDTQAFEAYDDGPPARADAAPAANVEWSVLPDDKKAEIGRFPEPKIGVFSAPSGFYRSRRIAIVARVKGDKGSELARGTATIELDPVPSWVPWLGIGWVVLFGVVLSVILWKWERLCPQCTPPGISVSPPVVTLGSGQAQQFLASAAATWTNTVNAAGLYIAPSKIDIEQLVTITATSISDPKQSAMAVVRLSPVGSLSVVPSKIIVKQKQSVDLTTSATGIGSITPIWLRPAAGDIAPTGRYTAPDDPKPQSIIVLAQAQVPSPAAGGAPSMLVAGSLVSVVPEKPDNCPTQPESGLWGLVLLVGLVGALGGLTHAIGSFGTYVGNRELKASWLLWYSLKPVLSAAVAVLVYFVFRAGLGAPDLGLGAGDCLKIAGFAGLVGLFAEQATVKLRDIFEAIFTPRRDPREDKAGEVAKNTAKTAGADKPASDQKTDQQKAGEQKAGTQKTDEQKAGKGT